MNKRIKLLVSLTIAAQAFAREEYTRNFDKTAALGNGGFALNLISRQTWVPVLPRSSMTGCRTAMLRPARFPWRRKGLRTEILRLLVFAGGESVMSPGVAAGI